MADAEKKLMAEEEPRVEGVEASTQTREAAGESGAPHEAPKPREAQTVEVPAEAPTMTPITAVVSPVKDELEQEIEEVLAEDLGKIYQNLSAEKKQEFKREGERTAGLIRQMLQKGKFHARKILRLIRHWLRLIPGVNRFFLEQTSKIKTDRIIQIAEEEKQK